MKINQDYYAWLINYINKGPYDARSYQLMLEELNKFPFLSKHPMDENRRADAADLRRKYERLNQLPFAVADIEYSASIFEVMVALAIRIEDDIMYDPDYGDRTSEWFWMMAENMGLTELDDENCDYSRLGNIFTNFYERKYDADGRGGGCLFHTNDASIDMRNLEIWDQCGVFLNEFISNYGG